MKGSFIILLICLQCMPSVSRPASSASVPASPAPGGTLRASLSSPQAISIKSSFGRLWREGEHVSRRTGLMMGYIIWTAAPTCANAGSIQCPPLILSNRDPFSFSAHTSTKQQPNRFKPDRGQDEFPQIQLVQKGLGCNVRRLNKLRFQFSGTHRHLPLNPEVHRSHLYSNSAGSSSQYASIAP